MTSAEKVTIKQSRYFVYSLYSNGTVTKASVKDMDNEREVPRYKDERGVFVWLQRERPYVKWLVAKHFLDGTGRTLEHIDGNEENCSADNLRYARRDRTGDSKLFTKVTIDGIEYGSIAAAERALMVSQGYLTKYFKGQVAGTLLEGKNIQIKGE